MQRLINSRSCKHYSPHSLRRQVPLLYVTCEIELGRVCKEMDSDLASFRKFLFR